MDSGRRRPRRIFLARSSMKFRQPAIPGPSFARSLESWSRLSTSAIPASPCADVRRQGLAREPEHVNLTVSGVSGAAGGLPINFDFDSLDSCERRHGRDPNPSLSSPGVTLNLVTRRGTKYCGAPRAPFTPTAPAGTTGSKREVRSGRTASGSGAQRSERVSDGHLPRRGRGDPYHENQQFWNAKLSAQPVPSNSLTLSYIAAKTE
jgi:hypothetical protein